MTSTVYTIETKGNGLLAARFNSETPNISTRGETVSFEFWATDGTKNLTVSGSVTIDSVEFYDSVTVESGATLTITSNGKLLTGSLTSNGTIDNDGIIINDLGINNSFEDLVEYGDYAGKFSTTETLNGKQKYREFIPSDANVDSLLVGIEPNNELENKNVPPIWGVVESVSDPRNPALNTKNYQMTVRILAEKSEYSDHSTAETKPQGVTNASRLYIWR